MTTRTSVALWVIGVGLALAALAGVPLIAADMVVGPVFWWAGLGVAVTGMVVLATAIRGQREANARERLGRTIDIEQLELERHALVLREAHVAGQIDRNRKKGWTARRMRKGIDLVVVAADIETLLRRNANEFRRMGVTPSPRSMNQVEGPQLLRPGSAESPS